MILAQMVALYPVEVEDLAWQLQSARAGVLILLMGAVTANAPAVLLEAQEKRQQ
jgi:hypothetical protein